MTAHLTGRLTVNVKMMAHQTRHVPPFLRVRGYDPHRIPHTVVPHAGGGGHA